MIPREVEERLVDYGNARAMQRVREIAATHAALVAAIERAIEAKPAGIPAPLPSFAVNDEIRQRPDNQFVTRQKYEADTNALAKAHVAAARAHIDASNRAEAAEAERDQLREQVQNEQRWADERIGMLKTERDRLAAALGEAQARIEVMRTALRMYALPEHWMALAGDPDGPRVVWIARTHLDANPDGYSTAFQVLAALAPVPS